MSEPIKTCPENVDVLLYFPDFKTWTIGKLQPREGWGLPLCTWVDQWNEDEFEVADSMIPPQPTHWEELPATAPPYTEV